MRGFRATRSCRLSDLHPRKIMSKAWEVEVCWSVVLGKVGILQAAKSGNAPHSSETNAPLKLKAREGNTAAVPLAVVLSAKRLSYELEVLNVSLAVPDDLELAPLAYLAGYIARACEEKLPCESCKVLLQESKPCGSIYDLVKKIDNGQLRYPNMEIVKICKLTCDFVSEVMKDTEVRRSGNLCKLLHSALLPYFVTCPALRCGSSSPQHTNHLCDVFLKKLLRPMLANWAGNVSATVQRLHNQAQSEYTPAYQPSTDYCNKKHAICSDWRNIIGVTDFKIKDGKHSVGINGLAPDDSVKGVIQGVPKEFTIQEIIETIDGFQFYPARRMGENPTTVILTFATSEVPRCVYPYETANRYTLPKKTVPVCSVCYEVGRRNTACPRPRGCGCHECGTRDPGLNPTCDAECYLCEGAHVTGTKGCSRRSVTTYVIRQKEQQQRRQVPAQHHAKLQQTCDRRCQWSTCGSRGETVLRAKFEGPIGDFKTKEEEYLQRRFNTWR
ncbi:hypothetical protein HPB48_022359 [Haemaphysalis longicornis]|uniref:Uncharacterized protein n=1 Tax=Haemaphysalis longicornis TaxID=44386 RepID=A0A9J6FQS6_HAELO|nr:hypothetical protein HPB48_022359 [Haemaphysalis longicornis]